MEENTPQGEVVMRTLLVKITDEEKAKKADLLAELQIEKTSLEEEKKAATSGFSSKIKVIVKSLNKLSLEVRDGKEERAVECTMVKDFEKNEIRWIYKGEVVESREMTPEDRQIEMNTSYEDQSKKPKKKGRKGSLSVVEAAKPEQEEISDVIKQETSRKTKRSSLDGAYGLEQ